MTKYSLINLCIKIYNEKKANISFIKVLYNIIPVLSISFFILTVFYWNNQNYGLALSYDGKEIATIQSEETYEKVTQMIKQCSTEKCLHCPEYKLTVVNTPAYSSVFDIKNKIIAQSDTEVKEAFGVYSDGKFIIAIENEQDINETFNYIKEEAKLGDENAEVRFIENIEIIKGLYPLEDIKDKNYINGILQHGISTQIEYVVKENETLESIALDFDMDMNELKSINNIGDNDGVSLGDKLIIEVIEIPIHVETTKIEEIQTEIPYEVIREEDANQYENWESINIIGKNGLESEINKVIYINGMEKSREEIKKEIIESPINQHVAFGTKKRIRSKEPYKSLFDNKNRNKYSENGKLLWPVPFTHNITSSYGPRDGGFHKGIDISSNGIHGHDIISSADGIVEFAGNSKGYGNHVKVSHGNGITTLYAHCENLSVKSGQKVSMGQKIASVGTTGNSTGYHVHFEVIVNGDKLNPLNFV